MISFDPFKELVSIEQLLALRTQAAKLKNLKKSIQDIEVEVQQIINQIKGRADFPENAYDSLDTLFKSILENTASSKAHKNPTIDEVSAQLLPWAEYLYIFERNGVPEEHAKRLAEVFNDRNKALKYLQDFARQNPNAQVMHDANLFVLPDKTKIDWKAWQILAQRNLLDPEFRTLILPQAVELEQSIKATTSPDKKKQPTRDDIKKAENEISETNKQWKALKRKHGSLTPEQEQDYQRLTQDLSSKRIALANLGPVFSNQLSLETLKACREKLISESSAAYNILLENGLTKKDYIKFSKLKRQDDDDQIPKMTIDGRAIGYPGIYIMKVPVMNDIHAARAACLGKLTNCCQSLSGEAGEPCAIHGLTSPYGGFYVLCQGDVNNPSVKDPLLAQCWAWRSQNEAIVFDSVEIGAQNISQFLHSEKEVDEEDYEFDDENPDEYHEQFERTHIDIDDDVTKLAVKCFEYLALQIIKNKHTNKIACGTSSGISRFLGLYSPYIQTESFKDYGGYCDSITQRVVYDTLHPYFWFEQREECAQESIRLINDVMSDKGLLVENVYFCKLLNWALLDHQEKLIEKIIDISKENSREAELSELKENMLVFIGEVQGSEMYSLDKIEKYVSLIDAKKLYVDTHNEKQTTTLLLSAELGLTEIVSHLLEKKASLDVRDVEGNTSLIKACEHGHSETAIKLLEHGVKIDEMNQKGNTAVMLAVRFGFDDLALELIERKANINIKNGDGQTALALSVANDRRDLTLKLIEKGAEIKGSHAIHAAVQSGLIDQGEVILQLLSKGADIDEKDTNNDGRTALMAAVLYSYTELVSLLLDHGANPNVKDDFGETALLTVCDNGETAIALKLIENGANLNDANALGQTPLSKAVSHGHMELAVMLFEKLLDKGFNIYEWKSDHNITALMCIAMVGHTEFAFKLIKAGVKIDDKDNLGETALMKACKFGMRETVLLLLKEKASVNEKDNIGQTALMKSIMHNHYELALTLIDNGAHINEQDQNGATALAIACEHGWDEFALKIIDMGANINHKDNFGETALMKACQRGYTALALMLVENGADINDWKSDNGTSLIMEASLYGHTELVLKILNAGAKINEKDDLFETALMKACASGQSETALTLISEGAQIEGKNIYGLNALMLAITHGHNTLASTLIDKGANVNEMNYDGTTVLMMAGQYGLREIVIKLINKGAKLEPVDKLLEAFGATELVLTIIKKLLDTGSNLNEWRNSLGSTTLMTVAGLGDTELALRLINAGASVNDKNDYGETALMISCQNGQIETALKLIEAKADINDKDSNGKSVLMHAIQSRNDVLALRLIDMGADIHTNDHNNTTSLMIACRNGSSKIALKLIEKGVDIEAMDIDGFNALSMASQYGHGDIALKLIEMLIDKEANINQWKNQAGDTALMIAAQLGHTGLVEKLIDKEGDVSGKNNDCETALMKACEQGHIEIALKLINTGAQVDEKNFMGMTSLMKACMSGQKELALMLIKNGASIHEKDNIGNTALMWAAKNLHREVILELIKKGASIQEPDINGETALMWVNPELATEMKNAAKLEEKLALESRKDDVLLPIALDKVVNQLRKKLYFLGHREIIDPELRNIMSQIVKEFQNISAQDFAGLDSYEEELVLEKILIKMGTKHNEALKIDDATKLKLADALKTVDSAALKQQALK